jgi:hypothetical protein
MNRFTPSDLVYTEKLDEAPLVYLFSKPDAGFLLLSADDVAMPILGYSDNATLDATKMPENLRWWISQYAQEIATAAKANLSKQSYTLSKSEDRATIVPIGGNILWNQDAPYNNMCPEIDGEKCLTGCTATAMAIIMYNHKWPAQGTGDITFDWRGQTLSADFSSMTFDWDNMLDNYSDSYTDAQQDAVALLMKACAYSIGSDFGVEATEGNEYRVINTLTENFDYSNEALGIDRESFGYTDWVNMIYSSLAEGLPVFYTGYNYASGHAFIVDGYDANDYFHLNWGWGGYFNGYFRLNALDPCSNPLTDTTTGYSFNYNQIALINLKPRTNETKVNHAIGVSDTFSYEYNPTSHSARTHGKFKSYSSTNYTYHFGLKFTDANGNISYSDSGYNYQLQPYEFYSDYDTNIPELDPGTYKVDCVFAHYSPETGRDEWQNIYCRPDNPTSFYATIDDDGSVTLFDDLHISPIKASDVNLSAAFVADYEFSVNANYTNVNDVDNRAELYFAFIDPDFHDILAISDKYLLDINACETKTTSVDNRFAECNIETGKEYSFAILQKLSNGEYSLISDIIPVKYIDMPESSVVTASNFVIENSDAVDPKNVNCSITLTCEEGAFVDYLDGYLYNDEMEYQHEYGFSQQVYLFEGETKDVNLRYQFNSLEPGKNYYLRVFFGYESVWAPFTVATSSVEALAADSRNAITEVSDNSWLITTTADISSVVIYAMDGSRQSPSVAISGNTATIDTAALLPGIYLVTVTTPEGISVSKMKR